MIEELEKRCDVFVANAHDAETCVGVPSWEEVDVLILLGDRWEVLYAAVDAACSRIPIAHIHGGESTYGAMDDSMRHAISKLSHLHFVANHDFAAVLRKMGERNIWVTGAPGLDNMVPYMKMKRKPEKYFVVTYHPETLGDDHLPALIAALKEFPDYTVLWTAVNNDPGSDNVRQTIKDAGIRMAHWSLDQYLLQIHQAAAVIGNSSSGIIEAPYLGVPTVNIGKRQEGRPMGASIWSTDGDLVKGIENMIQLAIDYDGSFDHLYGEPGASRHIAEVIATHPLDDILRKPWAI